MSAPELQGRAFGRYVLGPRIAAGGMGEVFLAVQLGLGRFQKPLVLKLLLPHLAEDDGAIRMFLDEAQLAGQMSHPNVVQVLDVGLVDGRYFIAMELVRGVSASELIRALAWSERELPAPVLVWLGRALLDGLDHAHRLTDRAGEPLHVVHRDVTPHNVLVSERGEVKLADFGIAKAKGSSSSTAPGTVRGKFEYLAPEQILERPVDARADVYGAALTLFHLAALESPFHREGEARTLRAALEQPLPDLHALRPDLPPALCAAITRGGAKQLETRFESAAAFRDALPPLEPTAMAALGAVVREVCHERLERLEAQTAHAKGLRPFTTTSAQRRRRWWRLAGAGAGLGVAATAALVVWPAAPEPAGASEVLALPSPAVEASPAPPSVATPEPQVATAPTTAPTPEAKPARVKAAPSRRGSGFLTVDARPWASVYVDGRHIGDTPIDAHPTPAGTAQVVLSNPQLGKRVVRRVTITPGAATLLKVDLR